MRSHTLRAPVLLATLVSGCASTPTITGGADGATISQAQAEAHSGPKARITVGNIIDKSAEAGKRSLSRQLGLLNRSAGKVEAPDTAGVTGGIRDMLTTSSCWSVSTSGMPWWSRTSLPPAGSGTRAVFPWAGLKARSFW